MASEEAHAYPQQPDLPTQSSDYAITITSCNSITAATIVLRRESLNIKYGPNGIGKSTIARALVLNAEGDEALQELLPFRYRHGDADDAPAVVGADEIENVLVFDERYVSQFVFQPDEVVKNSFEIFIRTPEYQAGIEELELIFEGVKKVFLENQALDAVIKSFTELRNAFTITKAGGIAKTSKGFKALGMGGKLATIPQPLVGYANFLHSDDPAGWLTWQSKGKTYLDLSDNCPFCSIPNVDKSTAVHVSAEYESAAVRNMSALRLVIDKLAGFFVPERLEQLRKVTTSLDGLSPEQDQFLAGLRGQVETLLVQRSVSPLSTKGPIGTVVAWHVRRSRSSCLTRRSTSCVRCCAVGLSPSSKRCARESCCVPPKARRTPRSRRRPGYRCRRWGCGGAVSVSGVWRACRMRRARVVRGLSMTMRSGVCSR